MYTENLAKDVLLFTKAVLSNQLARFAPRTYVNLTHQTGRGSEAENASQIAQYFIQCFIDYGEQLGFTTQESSEFFKGKTILEYGPGDIMGVALLMYAHGAARVDCIDRFELSKLSETNISVYCELLKSLSTEQRARADHAFEDIGNPASGFNAAAIHYKITRDGLTDGREKYDLIVSRAVLEHVNDIEMTMQDIKQNLKPSGLSIHQVDLKSHGLDRYTDFDFLTWPSSLYRLMYSHKGFPNRWRIDKYRQLAARSGLKMTKLKATDCLDDEKITAIQAKVAKEFLGISRHDLSWMGFWMILTHA